MLRRLPLALLLLAGCTSLDDSSLDASVGQEDAAQALPDAAEVLADGNAGPDAHTQQDASAPADASSQTDSGDDLGTDAAPAIDLNATAEVWLGIGDQEMEGYGSPLELPEGYPPTDGSLRCVDAAMHVVQAKEPCGRSESGVGPLGLFGWHRSRAIGKPVIVVNAGARGLRSDDWKPADQVYKEALARLDVALAEPNTRFAGVVHCDGVENAIDDRPTWLSDWNLSENAMRWDIGGSAPAGVPWIVRRLSTRYLDGVAMPALASVRTDQSMFVHADSRRILVEEWDGVYVELPTKGQDRLARMMVEALTAWEAR